MAVLLHIGFSKAGSTYLQNWFEHHPEMYFQPKYMAEGFYNAWQLASYAERTQKISDNYVLSCEDLTLWQGTPYVYGLRGHTPYNYRQYQNNICDSLYHLYPHAKVLLVTRGYTTIFASIYAQYLCMGGSLSSQELMRSHKEMFSAMLDYDYTIKLYRKKFGAANVILLPYELLRDDRLKFLSLIENQMHIKEHFGFTSDRANVSLSEQTLTIYYKVSGLVYSILLPLPISWSTSIYKGYIKWLGKKSTRSILISLSKFVTNKVAIHNPEMESLINSMKGKADLLQNEVLYQPYLKEYLN